MIHSFASAGVNFLYMVVPHCLQLLNMDRIKIKEISPFSESLTQKKDLQRLGEVLCISERWVEIFFCLT